MTGEGADPDREDLLRFGLVAAIAAGHDPWDARQWAEGDLIQFAEYVLLQHG